jgi:hypothetical protein
VSALRLIAEACIPAALGFVVTLILINGFSWAAFFAMAATVTSQGGLLIGEFAAASGLRRLPYRERLRRGLFIMIPFGATAFVALLVLIVVGLGGGVPSNDFFIGPAIVISLMLGASILLAPALVLDGDAAATLSRAVTSVWRLVLAVILGALYVLALTGAVWLVPDLLVTRGIVSDSAVALVRAAAGWLAVALLAIPFWSTVTRLYVTPQRRESANDQILR